MGIGMCLEQCNIAIQVALPDEKVPVGTSLGVFARTLGSSISVAVAQNVFERDLTRSLSSSIPDLPAGVVTGSGATNLVSNLQNALGDNAAAIQKVIELYNGAVTKTFLVALVFAACTLPFGFVVEWKNVKTEGKRKEQEKAMKKEANKISEDV